MILLCVLIKYIIYIIVHIRRPKSNQYLLEKKLIKTEDKENDAMSVDSLEENEAENLLNDDKKVAV